MIGFVVHEGEHEVQELVVDQVLMRVVVKGDVAAQVHSLLLDLVVAVLVNLENERLDALLIGQNVLEGR